MHILSTDLLRRIYRANYRAFWEVLSRGDRRYRVLLNNDRAGIYAIGYALPRPIDHGIALAEIVTLAGVTFVLLLALLGTINRLAGRHPVTGRDLLREIRQSFYRKLFLLFVAASVVPVLALALVTRNYLAGQLREGLESGAVGTASAEDVKSGLKDGDFVAAFNVYDCTGEKKGESLCYRCRYGGRPVVSIFAREVDDKLAKLIQEVDKTVGDNKGEQMAAFVVLLTDDPDAAEKELVALAEKHKIKNTPLTTFDGEAGPPDYKLNKDAEVTVLMWNKSKVESNHGFKSGELDDKSISTIVKEAEKLPE